MSRSPVSLAIFRGRVGDRNERGMQGAQIVGRALAARYGLKAHEIGTPAAMPGARWDIELQRAQSGLRALADHVGAAFRSGSRPVTTMGRCACALATLPVVSRSWPDARIFWFDAHGDCNTPESSATGYIGGMVLTGAAGLWDSGLGAGLDLAKVTLVGARDLDPAEAQRIAARRPHCVAAADLAVGELEQSLGDGPVYVHLDCDVLEPGIVPTEYRVPGGLSLRQLQAALAVLARREVVGLEIAEFEGSEPGKAEAACPAELIDALDPVINALLG